MNHTWPLQMWCITSNKFETRFSEHYSLTRSRKGVLRSRAFDVLAFHMVTMPEWVLFVCRLVCVWRSSCVFQNNSAFIVIWNFSTYTEADEERISWLGVRITWLCVWLCCWFWMWYGCMKVPFRRPGVMSETFVSSPGLLLSSTFHSSSSSSSSSSKVSGGGGGYIVSITDPNDTYIITVPLCLLASLWG
jgi:hypothetical protein